MYKVIAMNSVPFSINESLVKDDGIPWDQYSEWYDTLATSFLPYIGLRDQVVKEVQRFVGDKESVLIDLGAGTGNITKSLLDGIESGTFFLFDISKEFIVKAYDKVRDRENVFAYHSDICTDNFGVDQGVVDRINSHDCKKVCILNNVVYTLSEENRIKLMENISSVLRSGDRIIVHDPLSRIDLTMIKDLFVAHMRTKDVSLRKRISTMYTNFNNFINIGRFNRNYLGGNTYRFLDLEEQTSIFRNFGFNEIAVYDSKYLQSVVVYEKL